MSHFSHRLRSLHGTSPSGFRALGGPSTVLEHPGIRRLARELWSADVAQVVLPRR